MSRPDWHSIESLFHRVSALPEAERAALLEVESAGDPALRAEVESLLRADSLAGDLVRETVADSATAFGAAHEASILGRRVGDYELLRPLGHGGMGMVYLARRADAEFEKLVAIKFARRAFASGPLLQRFRMERRILARLEHPHIARLLDAGATEDGEPFVVMEFVEGERIDAFAERMRLTTERRLELFLQVCSAVQYAHRNLVVHRDLKPGNILVMADGTPKLLDFGIAKLLEETETDTGEETSHTARLFTPEYASPEQQRGEAVTTASDVYSLGVLLHVLLTGARPTAERLNGDLTPDLRTIASKAMRTEPSERYPTVQELAEDVRRYLGGHPISARPASVAYRARKFLRRNAGRVAAAAAAIVALVVITTVYTVRLSQERDAAEIARLKAERVSAFMIDLFQYVDPEANRGETITARELLDAAAEQLDTALVDQPEVRATMLYNIGDVYQKIGLRAEAEPLLHRAMALLEARGTPADTQLAIVTYGLASAVDAAAQESLFTLAASRGDSSGSDVSINARLRLASMLNDRGRTADAEAMIRQQLTVIDTVEDRWGDMRSFAEFLLAMVTHTDGRLVEAESLARTSYERRRRELGPDEPRTLQSLRQLTLVLSTAGKLEETLARTRELRTLLTRLYGADDAGVHNALATEARMLRELGRLAEAESVATLAIEERRRIGGERGTIFATALRTLARLQAESGRAGAALQNARRAAEIMHESTGGSWSWVAAPTIDVVEILIGLQRWQEAETLARAAARNDSAAFRPENVRSTMMLANLARILTHTGRAEQADSILRVILPRMQAGFAGANARMAVALIAKAEASLALGNYSAADSAARDALAIREALAPDYHAWHAEARAALGLALVRQGATAEGRAMLERAHAELRAVRGEAHGETAFARRALAEARRAGP